MASEAQHGAEVERVIARLRPHGRALLWPSLAFIAATGAFAYYFGRFGLEWQNTLVLVAAAAIVVLMWVLPLLRWLTTRYIITSRRIVILEGLFVRTRRELQHSRGYDITVRKTAFQSLFRSGDLRLNSGYESPVTLHDVPGANLVQSALHELSEHAARPLSMPPYPGAVPGGLA